MLLFLLASENCTELVKNTQGILFYSVPHHGSKLAKINIPWLLGQSVEITEVKKGKLLSYHMHMHQVCKSNVQYNICMIFFLFQFQVVLRLWSFTGSFCPFTRKIDFMQKWCPLSSQKQPLCTLPTLGLWMRNLQVKILVL